VPQTGLGTVTIVLIRDGGVDRPFAIGVAILQIVAGLTRARSRFNRMNYDPVADPMISSTAGNTRKTANATIQIVRATTDR
jgi:hypothetical protein